MKVKTLDCTSWLQGAFQRKPITTLCMCLLFGTQYSISSVSSKNGGFFLVLQSVESEEKLLEVLIKVHIQIKEVGLKQINLCPNTHPILTFPESFSIKNFLKAFLE